MITRRRALLFLAAPAIVRATTLMPIRAFLDPVADINWHNELRQFLLGSGVPDGTVITGYTSSRSFEIIL